jgi:hypothetical protein
VQSIEIGTVLYALIAVLLHVCNRSCNGDYTQGQLPTEQTKFPRVKDIKPGKWVSQPHSLGGSVGSLGKGRAKTVTLLTGLDRGREDERTLVL